MASIFLSHASSDKKLVRRIANELRAAGHEPWLDEEEVPVGKSIPGAVQQALRNADFMIPCLSKAYAESAWAAAELAAAIMHQFGERRERILPVRLEDVPPPDLIASIAYVDLFPDKQARTRGMVRLKKSIAAHEAGRDANSSIHPQATGSGIDDRELPPTSKSASVRRFVSRYKLIIGIGFTLLTIIAFAVQAQNKGNASTRAPNDMPVRLPAASAPFDVAPTPMYQNGVIECGDVLPSASMWCRSETFDDNDKTDTSRRSLNNPVDASLRCARGPLSASVVLHAGCSRENRREESMVELAVEGNVQREGPCSNTVSSGAKLAMQWHARVLTKKASRLTVVAQHSAQDAFCILTIGRWSKPLRATLKDEMELPEDWEVPIAMSCESNVSWIATDVPTPTGSNRCSRVVRSASARVTLRLIPVGLAVGYRCGPGKEPVSGPGPCKCPDGFVPQLDLENYNVCAPRNQATR